LYEKFSARGVAFVSMTSMSKQMAEEFVKEFSIPWPNGYSLTSEELVLLGVKSGVSMPGYELVPSVYVVGTDGRVRWCDNQGRFRHKEPTIWAKELEQAVELALAESKKVQP
jgi:hypothetical protein